jgi:hypothetical protein
MLALATDHNAAYLVGNLVAILALAAGALWLGLRALDRRGRYAAATATSPMRPAPPAPTRPTGSSVAPPGFAEPASVFVPSATPTRSRIGRSRRERTTDAIAAGVCAVLLVGALVHFTGHVGRSGPWDTPQGRQIRAVFVGSCQLGNRGTIDCDCAFEHLTAAPPYDTPAGLLAGQHAYYESVMTALSTHDASALPPGFIDTVRACARG